MYDYDAWQKKSYDEFVLPEFKTDHKRLREYLILGLVSEVGELFGKYAKLKRGDLVDPESILQECGDILWFVSTFAYLYGIPLSGVIDATLNPNELAPKYCLLEMISSAATAYNLWLENDKRVWNIWVLSDIIRYIESLTKQPFSALLDMNYTKLSDRKNRGVLQGNGDNR